MNELNKKSSRVRNVNLEQKARLSPLEKFAVSIARHIGTMGFFLIIFLWTIFWLGWNTGGPVEMRFDPYPAFVLWLFLSNMIQLFLMPLLLIGQNLEARHSEARAEADYEVNVRAEKEIGEVLARLDRQDEVLRKILGQNNS
jgi:uncharacterized membrane protein